MTPPTLLLVAHGTRDEVGAAASARLADTVARRLPGVDVRLAYADVRGPTVADALDRPPGPAGLVVVPAFLASGYHVRTDLPAQLAALPGAAVPVTGSSDGAGPPLGAGQFGTGPRGAGASGGGAGASGGAGGLAALGAGARSVAGPGGPVVVTPALGPDHRLVAAAGDRLRSAGARSGDTVVLGGAGSSDPAARAEVHQAARRLGRLLGGPVAVGFLTGTGPRLADVLDRADADGRRVALGSWLLAPGYFADRLARLGAEHADVCAAPLSGHAAVADTVLARYRTALARTHRVA